MKRKIVWQIALLLALLVLGSSAAAEQPRATLTPDAVLDADAQVRDLADEIAEQFGISIMMGNECLGAIEPYSFEITSEYVPLIPFILYKDSAEVMEQLELLRSCLSKYPKELFDNLKDQSSDGLRVMLVRRIYMPDLNNTATGITHRDRYYNIVLEVRKFSEETVHHEMWHAIEYCIREKYPGAFLLWNALNPPGFHYSGDFSHSMERYDPAYFNGEYGTYYDGEDRATVAETAFYPDREEWYAEHPGVRRKLDAMNLAMMAALGVSYDMVSDPR